MSTQEGNKLIAEFMGAILKPYPRDQRPSYYYDQSVSKTPTPSSSLWWGEWELQYHSSWDWLHPVINKLCDIGDSRQFNDAFYEKKLSILNAPLYCGIKDAWEMTVEAITWYNQQGTKINRKK